MSTNAERYAAAMAGLEKAYETIPDDLPERGQDGEARAWWMAIAPVMVSRVFLLRSVAYTDGN